MMLQSKTEVAMWGDKTVPASVTPDRTAVLMARRSGRVGVAIEPSPRGRWLV